MWEDAFREKFERQMREQFDMHFCREHAPVSERLACRRSVLSPVPQAPSAIRKAELTVSIAALPALRRRLLRYLRPPLGRELSSPSHPTRLA